MDKNFYLITPIFNPGGYKSRIDLYFKFAEYIKSCNVKLITIELTYGELPFQVTEPNNPNHIQLRTNSVLWHKEQLINIAVRRLPLDWQYMAWVDADIHFLNDNWVHDTIRALQFHPVVQMFAQALDLSINNEVVRTHNGIGWAYQSGLLEQEDVYKKMYGKIKLCYEDGQPKNLLELPPKIYHPGFAWAIRREAFDNLEGLLDIAILGSADQHMAHAFVNKIDATIHSGLNDNYKNMLSHYQTKCRKHINKNLGFVSGSIAHYWHGKKKDRGYTTRFNILIEHQYDPKLDLEIDWQGLYRWTPRCTDMHYDIYRYFLSRREDVGSED